MSKERFLTVLVPIKDSDCESGTYTVGTLPAVNSANINKIYKMSDGTYRRLWYNPTLEKYEYHAVVDREFPYLGRPLEIFDFTYDATRMGSAPSITAQNVMWFADKNSSGNDVTLEDLWTQECHVSFNGDNLYLKQIPTSSKSNEDARYKYNLDFVSEQVVLETVYLYDVVQPFITEKPISESATFNFYGDVYELAKRINASLLKSGLASLVRKYVPYPTNPSSTVQYLTYEQWNQLAVSPTPLIQDGVFINLTQATAFYNTIYLALKGDYNRYLMQYIYENVDGVYVVKGYQCKVGKDDKGEDISTDEKLLSFEKNTIHEALQRVFEDFELQYYVEKERNDQGIFTGNTVIWIDDCQHDFADLDSTSGDYVRDDEGIPTTSNPFDYGLDFDNDGNDSALLSKEKANSTDKIVTRITGVGGMENIPWYYPNPTADGWLKPVLKKKGEEQSSVEIDYPTSEGSTVAEATRYEKYLKNRIGRVLSFGIAKDIFFANDYIVNDRGQQSESSGTSFTVYYPVSDGEEGRKLAMELYINSNGSNFTKFTAELRRLNTPMGGYDSSQQYTNPTAFQKMCANRDGGDYVLLSPYQSQPFTLAMTFSMSSRPHSKRYDYEGYLFSAVTFNSVDTYGTSHYESGALHVYHNVSAYIGQNFYDEKNLTAVVFWNDSQQWNPEAGRYEHYISIRNAGYSVDGTEEGIIAPIPRVEGKNYKNNTSGIVPGRIHRCRTSNAANVNTGAYQGNIGGFTVFILNPQMGNSEWLSAFVSMKLLLYSYDSWYLGNTPISLSDYGIEGLSQNNSEYTPDIFDTIDFKRVKYVTPQKNLMPEVYVKTDGERRYYEAHNYWDDVNDTLYVGTADPMIGEVQVNTKVRNPIFKEKETDADSKHYKFENEYIQSIPKEHIEDFEDVKPTIKEQKNYIPVDVSETQFNANKTFFYTRNSTTGVYSQCTSNSTYSGSTQYYALLRIDVVDEFSYDTTDNDEIWETSEDGNISGEYKHPYFFARLRPMGFNLFDMALQDDMVLSMTTGDCGACNFKIAVDENTKKNTVQVWEYDVYGGDTYSTRGTKLYSKGDLRRYVNEENLHYDTNGTSAGYIFVNEGLNIESGGWNPSKMMYDRYTFSAEDVANGVVGSIKDESVVHFEGDVMTSGKFIASQQDTSESFVWVALMKDTDTYGTLMPSARQNYTDQNLNVYIRPLSIADVHDTDTSFEDDDENADKFVLTNIRLPQVYLRRAERDLARKLVAYMYDNNYQKFNFSIKFSRIFLAHNIAVDEDLNENSVLYVSFNNKIYRQYVRHYTYKMSKGEVLPEISVEMNDSLPLSRTFVEQQAAMQYKSHKITLSQANAATHKVVKALADRAIGKNNTTVISGNIVNKNNKTSLYEMGNDTKTQKVVSASMGESMATEYYKRDDFSVHEGTDLNIGGEVFLPTTYNTNGVLRKRKWDSETMTFVEDSAQAFAPAFIDGTNKALQNFQEQYTLLTSAPVDFTINYSKYYKLVNGVYVALTEAETFAANTYYSRSEGVVANSITPARVSGKQISYGQSGVLKPLYMESNVISEKNYTLLTSQPSDWGSSTSRSKYYMKDANGDFVPISGSPAFAANTFYEETPTNYDFTQTTEYFEIIQAFDQLDVALHCAYITITPNMQGGYDAEFNYNLAPARQDPEDERPAECPVMDGDYWFRTTT